MTDYKSIIFDLDGTLLDTLTDLANSANAVLEQNGFPIHPEESYKTFVGNGMFTLMKRALPDQNRDDETVKRMTTAMNDEYRNRWDETTAPYAGIPEMLDAFNEKGVPISILSNKPHEFTLKTVDKLLGDFSFEQVLGVRDGKEPKPDPAGAIEIAGLLDLDPSDIIFCGDSSVDMDTAKNAGMFAAGVLWGFRSEAELREHGADAIIQKPDDLLELIQE